MFWGYLSSNEPPQIRVRAYFEANHSNKKRIK